MRFSLPLPRKTADAPSPEGDFGVSGEDDDLGFTAQQPERPGPTLSAALAESVRFHIAEPRGYYTEQVDQFVDQARAALAHWEEDNYQQRRRIHDLEEELSLQVYDVQRLRTEMEMFKVQGTALVNPDGSYVTTSQQAAHAEITRLAQALQEAETARDQTTAELTALQTASSTSSPMVAEQAAAELAALQEFSAAQTEELTAMREWADAVEPQFTAMTETVAEAEETIASLRAENEALHAEVEALRAGHGGASDYPATLDHDSVSSTESYTPVEGYPNVPQYGAEEYAPVDEYAPIEVSTVDAATDPAYHPQGDDVEIDSTDAALPPFDSELPPGVELPRTIQPAQYAPAVPGAPLSSARGPIEHWAPELS